MTLKSKELLCQDGTVIGNIEDKGNLGNPISQLLVNRFDVAFSLLLKAAQIKSQHKADSVRAVMCWTNWFPGRNEPLASEKDQM
jgi:hypothetical protein